ncbi:unnamed protein product [Kluyveromyces dobzhanskii CBS 2104]|uniref:WGS project CCBQ000000000 data, contig 00272 n=1 Tax=Kluyveromyces dobzhanskii CBS 2104 TaxID=1427455 RepID=A0A0A8LAR4_9SACH|nr:unnamed protein product [Kluyveromyces dobzhanskii CBS 2104]
MSFDWLNVPGLNISSDPQASALGSSPPPTVSFSFNTADRTEESANKQQQDPQQAQHNSSTQQSNKLATDGTFPASGSVVNFGVSSSKDQIANGGVRSHSEPESAPLYIESPQELQVPLAVPEFQLTLEERKAYLRWFRDLHSKISYRPITLEDVFQFLANFRINDKVKERISHIFKTCSYAVNVEQFYAILRLTSHALQHQQLPTRGMIIEKASVLKPKSILSANAGQEVYEEVEEEPATATDKKVDFDGFASLLLTGNSIRKSIRRKIMKRRDQIKKVHFSKNLVTFASDISSKAVNTVTRKSDKQVVSPQNTTPPTDSNPSDSSLDLSLPMEQLLAKLSSRNKNNSALVKELPSDTQPETQEEREVLEDMKDSLSHFRQIRKVDNVTQLPTDMSSFETLGSGPSQPLEPLKPTATGSANHLFRQTVPPSRNSGILSDGPQQPFKPTPSKYSFKNMFQKNKITPEDPQRLNNVPPVPPQRKIQFEETLKPTSTGSANYLMKQQFQDFQEFQPFQSALPPQQQQQQQQQQYLTPQPSENRFHPQNPAQFLQPSAGGLVSSPRPQVSSNSNLSLDGYFDSRGPPTTPVVPSSSPGHQGMSNGVHFAAPFHQQNQEYGSNLNWQMQPSSQHLGVPMQATMDPNISNMRNVSPQPVRMQSDNILDDLKVLQQQVDQLHQTYSYDGRR